MAINAGRDNAPTYYGTDAQRLAMDKTNITDGTAFLVFSVATKTLTASYIWVSAINDWCTV